MALKKRKSTAVRGKKGRFIKDRNKERRTLYAYFRKQGLKPSEARKFRSPIKAVHKYRQVKQSALEKKKKYPALKIPKAPLKLSKKQEAVIEKRATMIPVSPIVMQGWKNLSPEERIYRLENMHRFYVAVGKATNKKVSVIAKEFLVQVKSLRSEENFYSALREVYNSAVGKRTGA